MEAATTFSVPWITRFGGFSGARGHKSEKALAGMEGTCKVWFYSLFLTEAVCGAAAEERWWDRRAMGRGGSATYLGMYELQSGHQGGGHGRVGSGWTRYLQKRDCHSCCVISSGIFQYQYMHG